MNEQVIEKPSLVATGILLVTGLGKAWLSAILPVMQPDILLNTNGALLNSGRLPAYAPSLAIYGILPPVVAVPSDILSNG